MSDQGFDPEGVDVGNASGFMAGAIREGWSASKAYREFQDAGGAMRREYFLQGYSDVRDALARMDTFASLDRNALPTGEDYAEWAMGKGGQYATQVTVFMRQKGTGETFTKDYTYITDEPHTPGEAEQAAQDEYGDAEIATTYEEVVTGAIAAQGFATTPWEGNQ